MKLITKVILLIVILMTPVIALYTYSSKQSTDIVEEQITIANQNRLAIFMQQIEGTMDQVAQYSNVIAQDPDFAALAGNIIPKDGYDYAVLLDTLQSKLNLFSTSTAWMNRITAYFPRSGHAVSSYNVLPYDEHYLIEHLKHGWNYRTVRVNGLTKQAFTRFFVEPSSAEDDFRQASIVVEVDLMAENIVSLLNTFKTKGNNDPFLYHGADEYLLNGSGNAALVGELIRTGDSVIEKSASEGYRMTTLHGERYLVYALTSQKLGWTLVDYTPVEDILAPVTRSRDSFYLTAALLILMGAGAASLIYTQVQVPIRLLSISASKLEEGELSTRVPNEKYRDFTSLFRQFNRMAARMQYSIEKVYREELRTKEAVMKQLQSQINPHFLYNSLAYIVSMAQLNRTEPVISMAHSLADYYKYTTRNERLDTTVREEVEFVRSYIDIMDMQLRKISTEFDIPSEMDRLEIPRLLFQPLVENAIIHGLEAKLGPGRIRMIGRILNGMATFVVEDDGVGMTSETIARMNDSLKLPESQGDSFGVWNVHQRLIHRYGPSAGLMLEQASEGGGIRVKIAWPIEKGE